MRFHEILFQTALFLKKIFLGRCQNQNKKALFTDSIFREGFGRREYALAGKGTSVNIKRAVQGEKGKLSPAVCFEGVGFHRALLQY